MRSARRRVLDPAGAARRGRAFYRRRAAETVELYRIRQGRLDAEIQGRQKPVVMELGGNAACLVDADADIDDAVDRLVFGGFYQSGQSCISVQRVQIHRDVYDEVKQKLTDKVGALKGGDPRDPDTFIGPMIS